MLLNENPDKFTLLREMGCTRDEFVRWLPGATRNAPMEIIADKAVIQLGSGTVTISLSQAAPRKIAMVSIPVLMVAFQFLHLDANARREFMAYFDLCTRRGGG